MKPYINSFGQNIYPKCTLVVIPGGTLYEGALVFDYFLFGLGLISVSLHTETLQKPYSKHTETKDPS